MAQSYHWMKLWIDILDDFRMGTLPDSLWRRTIEIFLLARTGGGDGQLPPVHEAAWRLRLTPDELEADLIAIEKATAVDGRPGIVQRTGSGWFVTNFVKRQERMSDAERQRRKRERDGESSHDGNESVTPRDPDQIRSEVEADQTTEEEQTTTDAAIAPVDAVVGRELLLEFGVREPSATKCAASPLPHITGWIADARAKGKQLQNPQGYVVGQLKTGIPPPTPVPEWQKFLGDHLCPTCHMHPCACEEFEEVKA